MVGNDVLVQIRACIFVIANFTNNFCRGYDRSKVHTFYETFKTTSVSASINDLSKQAR